MKRIDCEKCMNSMFEEDDRLRCYASSCQPKYEDMEEEKKALLEAFPDSFINEYNEFIARKRENLYIVLDNCEYPEDIHCKVLEWFSRSASCISLYSADWRNKKYQSMIRNCINDYLGTEFSADDMERIYEVLGNAINHELTLRFVRSGYDMDVLDA